MQGRFRQGEIVGHTDSRRRRSSLSCRLPPAVYEHAQQDGLQQRPGRRPTCCSSSTWSTADVLLELDLVDGRRAARARPGRRPACCSSSTMEEKRTTWIVHVTDDEAGSYLPLRKQERWYLARQMHHSRGSARRPKPPTKLRYLSRAVIGRLSSHEPVGPVVFSTWNTWIVNAWVSM
jgi:hypothetical protein